MDVSFVYAWGYANAYAYAYAAFSQGGATVIHPFRRIWPAFMQVCLGVCSPLRAAYNSGQSPPSDIAQQRERLRYNSTSSMLSPSRIGQIKIKEYQGFKAKAGSIDRVVIKHFFSFRSSWQM